jgi:hypothetical protein
MLAELEYLLTGKLQKFHGGYCSDVTIDIAIYGKQ